MSQGTKRQWDRGGGYVDRYNPPKSVTCPNGHPGPHSVYSPPYSFDPAWHFTCYACYVYGRHFSVPVSP